MRLLFLGGTVFLGRHLVEAALGQGAEVTLFNRGLTNPELFPEVEKLTGDRDHDLEALLGREWDAVIDTSGFIPRIVRASAELLAHAIDRYVFISSLSVYADISTGGAEENAPLASLADPSIETVTGESYGPLKALCEFVAEVALPGRLLVFRPGLIVGPHDPTDRFTYWVQRTARGGEVLAPMPPERQVQFIDVRDLAQWILRMVELRSTGVYNATGPGDYLSFRTLLEACRANSKQSAQFTWVDEPFLLAHNLESWTDLPLWLPESEAGLLAVDTTKAKTAGLSYRPLADTIRDTYNWARDHRQNLPLRAGLDSEREQDLLRAWHSRETTPIS